MLQRFLFFIIISVALIGCGVRHSVNIPPNRPPALISPTEPLPPFNQIMISGNFDVKLHTGYSKPQLNLTGDSRDIAQVIVMIKDTALLIKFNPGYPKFGPVRADIRTRRLNSFAYQGVGNISGHHINSSGLDLMLINPGQTTLGGNIYLRRLEVEGGTVHLSGVRSQNLQLVMRGNPSILLSGNVGISTINMDGKGRLGMYWIKSDHLTIRARGNSSIKLAGNVVKLDVELCDNAFFNGRYLEVYDLFVKTSGKSIAEVNASGKQHAFATDVSDIHFYHLPELRADLMAVDGAVLDMRNWNKYLLQHYTRYNKYYTSNS